MLSARHLVCSECCRLFAIRRIRVINALAFHCRQQTGLCRIQIIRMNLERRMVINQASLFKGNRLIVERVHPIVPMQLVCTNVPTPDTHLGYFGGQVELICSGSMARWSASFWEMSVAIPKNPLSLPRSSRISVTISGFQEQNCRLCVRNSTPALPNLPFLSFRKTPETLQPACQVPRSGPYCERRFHPPHEGQRQFFTNNFIGPIPKDARPLH